MVGSTWSKFSSEKLLLTLYMTYIYNATGGTGGALCRNMYSTFLEESQEYIQDENLIKATDIYKQAAEAWDEVAKALLPDELPRKIFFLPYLEEHHKSVCRLIFPEECINQHYSLPCNPESPPHGRSGKRDRERLEK